MSEPPKPAPTQGRDASSPWQLPAGGWKEVLLRVKNEVMDDRITLMAAGVAFYWLLAVSPAIAAGVSIWALFADPRAVTDAFDQMSGMMPEQARTLIGGQLQEIAGTASRALGVSALIGLLFSFWSANAGMKSLMEGLNVVWDTEEERGFFSLNARSFALLLVVLVFAAIAVASVAALPVIRGFGAGGAIADVLAVLRWPVLVVLAIGVVAIVYRYGPSRAPPHWRWVSPGAVLAMAGFLLVSALFSVYASNFGSYQETYGSLAAVIVTLLWFWLSATVVLVGGELDAELERQTLRDTQEGAPA